MSDGTLQTLDISMLEDVGTGANQLVQLDSNAKIPACGAAALTGISAITKSASDPTISTNPSLGTVFQNTTSGEMYICTDATAGENIWINVGDGTDNIEPSTLPRQGTQYGYHWGNNPRVTTIQKYSYTSGADAVDTTADLLEALSWGSDNTCSLTHGYCAGHQNGNPTNYNSNIIQKWPFASSSNATNVGNLSSGIYGAAGAANQDYGYTQGGGQSGPKINEVQRFSFSSDGDATDFGDISVTRAHASSSMSKTHGYCAGGQNTTPTFSNVIDKFAFASNVASTNVGDLIQAAMYMPGHQSLTHGYRAGGYDHNGGTYSINTIDKYSFSSDGNAIDVANLLEDNSGAGGSTQTDYGYVTGGGPAGAKHDKIQKFSFASGTDAADISNLIGNGYQSAGCQY